MRDSAMGADKIITVFEPSASRYVRMGEEFVEIILVVWCLRGSEIR